ncbi:AraC family transcriptional regulator, partial [Marinobacter sp.]|uniref:AraC family transcriptional regulator n=1 Tax=Marinobacter sp. TaxID=50741 RepID=UPI00356B48A7
LLSDWLDQEGLDAGQLRVALARWASRDNVPVPVWRDLLSRGLALVPGRVAPELDVGACVLPGHVGVLGYLVLASDTLGEAMMAYQRYETLFYGTRLAEIEVIGDQVEMRWPPSDNELGQQADGAAIAALVTFMRRQIDRAPPPVAVSFLESVESETAGAYETFFGCPVTWNDSHVRVRFPLHYLNLPMPRRDPTLRELLDRQARYQFSWQQWLDRSREQLARQYLADPSLTLTDIALLLGFSEQSSFTRAYRRWTGNSPGRDRRQWLSD